MTASEPASFALVTAMVIPRSLKEPVGLSPSYFMYTSASMPIGPGKPGDRNERRRPL